MFVTVIGPVTTVPFHASIQSPGGIHATRVASGEFTTRESSLMRLRCTAELLVFDAELMRYTGRQRQPIRLRGGGIMRAPRVNDQVAVNPHPRAVVLERRQVSRRPRTRALQSCPSSARKNSPAENPARDCSGPN